MAGRRKGRPAAGELARPRPKGGHRRRTDQERSNVEVEYHDVVNIVSKCNLLLELHCPILKATLVDCDNIIELYMFRNLV